MDLKCHVYRIAGVENMRDIGGYPTKDGRAIAMKRFIRSTSLAGIDDAGEDELRKIGVDCVIDLRSNAERRAAPDVIEQRDYIHFVHVPMLDYISSNFASGDFSNFPSSMTEMYIGLLERGKDDFKSVFDMFADVRFRHYLFHCTAGKDRTGVTAMLLLGLAGVCDEHIVKDYAFTGQFLNSVIVKNPPEGLPKYLFESNPETMRGTLDYLHSKYGGAAQYLEHIGVTGDKREQILEKLFLEK